MSKIIIYLIVVLISGAIAYNKPNITRDEYGKDWVRYIITNFANRQSELLLSRGMPQQEPSSILDKFKYKHDINLSLAAEKKYTEPNYFGAAAWQEFISKINPDNINAWRLATFLYSQAGYINKAKQLLQKGLLAHPDNSLLLLERSSIFGKLVNPDLNLKWAKQALSSFYRNKGNATMPKDDIRKLHLEVIGAYLRLDPTVEGQETKANILRVFRGLENWDPEVRERSTLYIRLLKEGKDAK